MRLLLNIISLLMPVLEKNLIYMNEMAQMSLYDTGVTAQYGDELLTLSTCDHSQTDGRFVVVAKRIQ